MLKTVFTLFQSRSEPQETPDPVIDTLARTVWGEARSEGVRGMEAVAAVILNRVCIAEENSGQYWWGGDISSVCRKPYQFSCWNAGDPNLPRLLKVSPGDPRFLAALRIARRAVSGVLPDPTGGATHYHADYVSPYWAKTHAPTAVIGRHLFYRLV